MIKVFLFDGSVVEYPTSTHVDIDDGHLTVSTVVEVDAPTIRRGVGQIQPPRKGKREHVDAIHAANNWTHVQLIDEESQA